MLELAVLGLLHEAPMHGYELRKRLHDTFGAFRAFSCGTVYPTLRRMARAELIEEQAVSGGQGWGRRARRVYRVTERGRQRFTELVTDSGPRSCHDDAFDVRLAFFAWTPVGTRIRVLEQRRRRVEQRRDRLRSALRSGGEECDRYTAQLHRLGLDKSEREVRWLDELIADERAVEDGSVRDRPVRHERGQDRHDGQVPTGQDSYTHER